MNKKQIALITLVIWLFFIAIFMLLFRWFDLEIFFILTLIGIIVIVELIKYRYVQPAYLKYMNYIIGAGIIIFGINVIKKIMEILVR